MPYIYLRNDECKAPFEFISFVPDNFSEIQNPPLIVFLHGSGERGWNPDQPLYGLGATFEEQQLPAAIIFPQCDGEHRAFYGEMHDRVWHAIERAVKEFNADPKRIYLIGYSMGGSSGIWLVSLHPGKFAGMVCIAPGITWMGAELPPKFPDEQVEKFNTMFVAENRPEAIAREIQSIPMWILQGTWDEPCPIEETRSVVSELRKLGCDPRVTEYDGMGHDSLVPALWEQGLFQWLFGQRLG